MNNLHLFSMHYEYPQIYFTLGNLLCQLADAMSQITAQTYLLKIYIYISLVISISIGEKFR